MARVRYHIGLQDGAHEMNKTLKQLLSFVLLAAPIAAVADTNSCQNPGGSASTGAGAGKVCVAAPEIDPASATSALTLLVGGLLTVSGRKSGR